MNVIVIINDSLRWDHLGCYGNHWIKTPNLDKLASEGTIFESCYSEGLPTIPSRTTFSPVVSLFPFGGGNALSPRMYYWLRYCGTKGSPPLWLRTYITFINLPWPLKEVLTYAIYSWSWGRPLDPWYQYHSGRRQVLQRGRQRQVCTPTIDTISQKYPLVAERGGHLCCPGCESGD